MALKVVALCAALGLGGGYVWQRQKAADVRKAAREEKRAVMSGSKSALIVEEGKELSREELDRMLMSGSKSGEVVLDNVDPEPVVPPAVEDENAKERTILPGSKSFRIVPPQAPEEKP